MKYDSGMTHFHENITAALRHMLGSNSEITEKYSPNDGSPAPLRDYLKEKYGKSYASHVGGGMRYSCKASTGFELAFNTIILNGDRNLTLSWSQVAKFIRDNWDEVFKKDKPKTDPACIDKPAVPQIGDYVSEDMLGELLTFDELAEMEGQLVVANYSTESKNWYKVVQVGKTVEQKPDGRRLLYRDNPKKKSFECSIGEWAFKSVTNMVQAEKMWRLKQPAEDKPAMTYLDKLREKYPKISIEDCWAWELNCPSDLFGGNTPNSCNELCLRNKSAAPCLDCWNLPCAADAVLMDIADGVDLLEDDYFEQYPEETTAEADSVPEIPEEKSNVEKSLDCETTQKWDLYCEGCKYDINSCCDYPETPDDYCACGDKRIPKAEADKSSENQIATTAETALRGDFDYSELDSDTAKNLRECETVIRQETAGYFTILGAKFKEAQSLLADHASGTFEKWYTAMGFKRQTVYNLIQRYDFLGSPTIGGREDTFEALPLTLSYEVSKPDAPAELVEKVLDGDITTNAEYLKLKAELDRTREECRQLDANSAAKDKEYERQLEEANKRADAAEKRADSSHREVLEQSNLATKMAEEKFKLEEQIKELESRPVDVAVQDNSELMEELEQLREENKRLKDDNVKSFLIRLTMDEYEELLKAVGKKPLLLDAVRHAKIIKL